MHPPYRGPRFAALLGAGAAAVVAGAAAAEPAPPFPALLAQAQSRAPRLAEAAATVRQVQGLARQAAVRPNPTLALDIENFSGRGPYGGFGQAETTLTIAQPVEFGAKRAARRHAGRADLEAARAREAQARSDFAADLAVAYAEAEAAGRRLGLAEQALGLAREAQRVAGILTDAGRESRLRTLQAGSAAAAAVAGLETAKAAQVEALARLSALSGSPAPFTAVEATLLDQAPPRRGADADALATPAVVAAEAERAAAARRVDVERVRAVPDVTASLGVRRFAGDDSSALVAGVSAPLPLFDRNRGAVSAARAELTAAEARLAAARLDARAALRTASFQIGAADARVSAGEAAVVAAVETHRLTRAGYEAGKLPLLELLNAQGALADARARVVEAQLARVRAAADLARLQGRAPFGD